MTAKMHLISSVTGFLSRHVLTACLHCIRRQHASQMWPPSVHFASGCGTALALGGPLALSGPLALGGPLALDTPLQSVDGGNRLRREWDDLRGEKPKGLKLKLSTAR